MLEKKVQIGDKFSRLEVIGRLEPDVKPSGQKHGQCLCRCDCGVEKPVQYSRLLSGETKSCGCLRADKARQRMKDNHAEYIKKKTKHGQGRRGVKPCPEYVTWGAMIQRCHNPNNPTYGYYGGRGIKVCDEWRADFRVFFSYVGQKPSLSHSLDRIDNDGNYEPGNVRWATRAEQGRNRRSLVLLGIATDALDKIIAITTEVCLQKIARDALATIKTLQEFNAVLRT